MKKTILVTGGAGYIGSAFVHSLDREKYDIVVIDNLCKGIRELISKDVLFINQDLVEKEGLEKVFMEHNFDCIVHFAGLKAVGESEEKPSMYFENNINGMINLLSLAEKYGIQKIVFSSTACVYKEKESGVYFEDDDLKSLSVYGYSKVVGEEILKQYKKLKNIDYVIFRYFNVVADIGLGYLDPDAQNIFPIIGEFLSGKRDNLFVFGNDYNTRDGSCIRDYIHLKDLIDAHIKAIEFDGSEIFNLGTQNSTSVFELLKCFEKESGRKINFNVVSRRQGDLGILLANSEKAKRLLGWEAKKNISDMVKDTLKVYDLI